MATGKLSPVHHNKHVSLYTVHTQVEHTLYMYIHHTPHILLTHMYTYTYRPPHYVLMFRHTFFYMHILIMKSANWPILRYGD